MITYAAVIIGCEKSKQLLQAVEFLEEMQLTGLVTDVVTFYAAISPCEAAKLSDSHGSSLR